ncbi:unnamed protein product [Amoebophrya sp. A25]|nr:unnamed protein product [Amoebophrya sp. A25]|eukprot:GSA25T00024903001.1
MLRIIHVDVIINLNFTLAQLALTLQLSNIDFPTAYMRVDF